MTARLLPQVLAGTQPLAVVGLGYVGLPVAVAFAQDRAVIGYDISTERVQALNGGLDSTGQVEAAALERARLLCTTDPSELAQAGCIIVAVPTPVDASHSPDLGPLAAASKAVGAQMPAGCTVIYESTVYPGATMEVCVPLLEAASGMKLGEDFWVGYSPERINPGDQVHTFERIVKVVSGSDETTCEQVAELYRSVVQAGVHKAPNIATAEAAKVIENTQRDINIALVNELALIFERMGLDSGDVLEAAGTKWNFLPFSPGLVGGHCIGVDPYYLTHKAERLGYHPQVVLAGRRINDSMGRYVAQRTVRRMVKNGVAPKGARVLVLGLSFKENLNDLRNTRVVDLVAELADWGLDTQIYDPLVDPDEARAAYDLDLSTEVPAGPFDAVVLAVAHEQFVRAGAEWIATLCAKGAVVADVKGCLDRESAARLGLDLWRL